MNAKKHPEIGFDSVLGSIWEGFGTVWGVLGVLPGASWPFWGRSKSIFFQTWVQDRLHKAFWKVWAAFGEGFGRISELSARLGADLGLG